MKVTTKTIMFGIILFSLFSAVYALEKATIYFKNGDKLDCIVDKYDTGKWVDIVDETGSRKTIKWDVINVVLFKNEKVTLEELTQNAAPAVTQSADAPKTDDAPMNLAQRLAQKDREKKEKEALAAGSGTTGKEVKNALPAAVPEKTVIPTVKPAQESAQKEKATIYYKNGDKLNCLIDNYEIGKYAVVVDDSGNKRIISWDNINEIVFIKEEVTQAAEDESSLPAIETAPVAPPVTPPASVPVTTVPASGSMLDQFKKSKTDTSDEKPVNVKEEIFKEDIREENKAQKPVYDFDKETGKMGVSYYKTLESDATRRAWIEDGGMLKSKSMTGNYTYMSMDMGDTDFSMHGFGFSYSGALKFINPPNYAQGKNLWNAFTIGAGGSFNIAVGSMEMDYSYSYWNGYQWVYVSNVTDMNMTNLTYDISANIGYTFGLGKYLSNSDWKGVMLGIYWKPNFTMSKSTVEIDGTFYDNDPTSSFNAAGMQWTIDWGDFGAMADRIAQEAHFTISGFILPKTDETPFLFSIGMGAVWY